MNQNLKDLLSIYLGELIYKWEFSNDAFERSKISEKMNAVYKLLDIEKKQEKWHEKIKTITNEKTNI